MLKGQKLGLTHYWEREIEVSEDLLASAVQDCRRAFEATGIGIAGAGGEGELVLAQEGILFNGADGLSCEDFVFPRIQVPRRQRKKPLGYCKTEHLPYDVCVQAALIVLKHHLENMITVASDAKDGDWQRAREICQSCLGYGSDFTLETIA
jgi:hypothetical protein